MKAPVPDIPFVAVPEHSDGFIDIVRSTEWIEVGRVLLSYNTLNTKDEKTYMQVYREMVSFLNWRLDDIKNAQTLLNLVTLYHMILAGRGAYRRLVDALGDYQRPVVEYVDFSNMPDHQGKFWTDNGKFLWTIDKQKWDIRLIAKLSYRIAK